MGQAAQETGGIGVTGTGRIDDGRRNGLDFDDAVLRDHERTVDVNVQRLRKILSESGYESYIQTVRGFGYRFGPV